MPFTYAHPAIALAFLRQKKMPISALVIGCLAPDYDYIFRMVLDGRFSHQWPGFLIYTLPLALLMYWVFHQVVKKVMIPQLPFYFRKKWADLYAFDGIKYLKNNFLWVITALMIGIFSHILWDSFTHAKTPLVQSLDFLRQEIQWLGFNPQPLFRYLQHFSTLLGLGLILISIFFYKSDSKSYPQNHFSALFWVILLLFSIIVFVIRLQWEVGYSSELLVTIAGSLHYGLLLACVLFYCKRLI